MRARTIRTVLTVVVLALLLFAVPLAAAVAAQYRGEAVQRLVDDAARVAAVAPGPTALDPADIATPPDGAAIGVYDSAGRRVSGSGPSHADEVVQQSLAGRIASGGGVGTLVAAVPIGAQEQVAGVVRAAIPQAVVDDRVRGAWLLMGALGCGVLLIAALVAALLARRISRPLRSVTEAAQRLGEGDFTVHVPAANIAEIDALARAVNTTAARLSGVLDRERAFSSDASHQLRTELAAMRVHLEGALLAIDAASRPQLTAALAEIDRLEQTVTNLLQLARDVPEDRSELRVAQLLDEVRSRWAPRFAERGRRLELLLPAALPSAVASQSAVRQILDVLLSNALQHGSGRTQLAARELQGGLSLEVCDDGSGIPDSVDPFARRVGRGGGTGIGLALARSLAEAEGGRLSLREHGPRPVFQIVLPAVGGAHRPQVAVGGSSASS